MSLRTFAEFTSDLPTGQIEDDADFVQLGGRPVAQAIADMLTQLGCRVEPVESAGHRGWEFRFRYARLRLWCQVTLIEGYLALFRDMSARWRIFAGDHRDFVELMVRLGDAVAGDARFHDVGWFHEHEMLSHLTGAVGPAGGFRDTPCLRMQAIEPADAE